MLLRLQEKTIYGPVHSRRLGRSLGINLLPASQKVCCFDCLYCQYGWSDFSALENARFPSIQEVVKQLESTLLSLADLPAYITFSGNGEPTLHPDFPEAVRQISQVRDRLSPSSRTAILSNAATLHRAPVREAIACLDRPIMKLDAGNPGFLKQYNRPAPGIDYTQIVQELQTIRPLTIQALFTKGEKGNYSTQNLADWIRVIMRLNPDDVQIYTLDRNPPADTIVPLSSDELKDIQKRLTRRGIKAAKY